MTSLSENYNKQLAVTIRWHLEELSGRNCPGVNYQVNIRGNCPGWISGSPQDYMSLSVAAENVNTHTHAHRQTDFDYKLSHAAEPKTRGLQLNNSDNAVPLTYKQTSCCLMEI